MVVWTSSPSEEPRLYGLIWFYIYIFFFFFLTIIGYLYIYAFFKSQNVLWFSVEQTLSHDRDRGLDSDVLRKHTYQILQGAQFLHKKNVSSLIFHFRCMLP